MSWRESNALAWRLFNTTGEILSRPDEVEFREMIANINSDILKLLVSMLVGETGIGIGIGRSEEGF